MTPQELLREYQRCADGWVRYIALSGPEYRSLQIAVFSVGNGWHLRVRTFNEPAGNRTLLDEYFLDLAAALSYPGLAALEAAVSLGAPLDSLAEASRAGR